MWQIGRRMLAAAWLVAAGFSGAQATPAAATGICQSYASTPVREGNYVTSINTISCSGNVGLRFNAVLNGPNGEQDRVQRYCLSCSGFSVKLSAPYAPGEWEAVTFGWTSSWDEYVYSTAIIP